jgi:hypothetical protein
MSYIGNQPVYQAFVTDQFSGNGSTTAFTMSVAPANTASVLVAVSGVLQDPSTYSVSGTTLTFSAAPPSGTGNISARYLGIPASGITNTAYSTKTEFTATAGQTTFTVPSYTVNFIQVYRNGVLLGNADYTATNGTTVVLTTGATAGDIVTTISFFVSSVLNAIPATNGAVTTPYILDGAVTQSKLASNVVGTGPAFSVSANASQSVPNATGTKLTFDTKQFDTANIFNTSTSRLTPNIAGYYQLNINAGVSSYAFVTQLYKNGAVYFGAQFASPYLTGIGTGANASLCVYANGTTDYFEVYVYQNGGASTTTYSGNANIFSGFLVRAA